MKKLITTCQINHYQPELFLRSTDWSFQMQLLANAYLLKLWVIYLEKFQLGGGLDAGPHWFFCTSLCDWCGKLAPPSPPIRCKIKTIHKLLVRVLTRISFHWHFEFFFHDSYWPSWLLQFWFYKTQLKSALRNIGYSGCDMNSLISLILSCLPHSY